jgi:protein-L-isoaspartate(D-aspartate) O-methyltransferase
VPEQLLEQLVLDGLLVVPVSGRMTVVRRTAGAPRVSHAGWYTFVPLVEP